MGHRGLCITLAIGKLQLCVCLHVYAECVYAEYVYAEVRTERVHNRETLVSILCVVALINKARCTSGIIESRIS